MKIYNSLTNKIEDFIPIHKNEVSMYVCGSTVYNYIHIGNSRPVIFFDTVARFFKYMGYKVKYVSNFTDIDDKIIAKAKQENVSETEISERYIKAIKETYRKLNCLPHDANPKVTENIDKIVEFIDLLVKKDGAYVIDGDVYFDVAKISEYGRLSGQTIENLINGARIDPNEKKHNPIDFTLWKKTEEGIKWKSPWSEGRPGWHTECVVMIDNIFKGPIDIHGGGLELKFPHHDNEIAQSICAHNHSIAHYWMHNGRIDMGGEKMSKSLGNVIWADELLNRTSYQVYRLLILNVPYRQPLDYRDELLAQATTDFEKINRAFISLFRKIDLECDDMKPLNGIKDQELLGIKKEFDEAMSDDFNTANAITAIFKATKHINNLIRNNQGEMDVLKQALKILEDFLWVLGMDIAINRLSDDEKELVEKWQQARKSKDFVLADNLRKQIADKGILL
ncbi:MAG: cysteine--tRNA ligase [Bacilli bacterium]|nr:cysteine--tRNA ligase [Bacilli bacterium]